MSNDPLFLKPNPYSPGLDDHGSVEPFQHAESTYGLQPSRAELIKRNRELEAALKLAQQNITQIMQRLGL